jgi:hypothetical protein
MHGPLDWSSTVAKLAITDHAISRFIERHAQGLTFSAARELIQERAQHAQRLETRTVLGDMQWRITEPDCILVVKRDSERSRAAGRKHRNRPGTQGAGGLVVVTVLPTVDQQWLEDETEEAAE